MEITSMNGPENSPADILRKYWNYDSFRHPQQEIIQTVLSGKDILALLPTGGGKSICFQVPALCLPGITLVVSPLIALMRDQVENLKKRGIAADALTSAINKDEQQVIIDNATFGGTKLLYVSPERLENPSFLKQLEQIPVSLIAVDEAHCISQWGYDFRPPYLRIAAIRPMFPKVPVIALTATATPRVVKDIMLRLQFDEERVISISFKRKNLSYNVMHTGNKPGALLELLQQHPGCAVVYTRNRRRTREIAETLQHNGISASYYHAGLEPDERNIRQQEWIEDKVRVMVATNAFGMGIDKPDVRLVVHVDIPDNAEAYFQEAGRAGRDGKEAAAWALYHGGDKLQLQENLERSFPEKPFILRVYNAAADYLKVAVNYGEGESYSFDVNDFIAKFKFPPIETLSSLKILALNGYIYFTESVFTPARVQVKIQGNDLYQFQQRNISYEPILKTLLRSYGNIFDQPVNISEKSICTKTNLELFELRQQLKILQQMKVLEYFPPEDSPRITWLQNRQSTQNIRLMPETYSERKKLHETNIQFMLNYLTENNCRSKTLQEYFGEENVSPCQKCDVCRTLNAHSESPATDQFLSLLKQLRQKGETSVRELSGTGNVHHKKLVSILRTMNDEGLIRFNERGNIALTIKGARMTE
jgi:ATP-dependent DNA helicase RecQ